MQQQAENPTSGNPPRCPKKKEKKTLHHRPSALFYSFFSILHCSHAFVSRRKKNGRRRARVFDGCRPPPIAFPKCNSSPCLLFSKLGEKWAKGEAIKPFRFVLVPLFLSSFLRGRCPRILRRFSAKIYGALSDGGGGGANGAFRGGGGPTVVRVCNQRRFCSNSIWI